MKQVCVLGAGTWGIALAQALAGDGHKVVVWSALPREIDNLSATHRHPYLQDVTLNDAIRYEKNIADAIRGSDLVLFAVPSVYLRSTAEQAKPYIPALSQSRPVCVSLSVRVAEPLVPASFPRSSRKVLSVRRTPPRVRLTIFVSCRFVG